MLSVCVWMCVRVHVTRTPMTQAIYRKASAAAAAYVLCAAAAKGGDSERDRQRQYHSELVAELHTRDSLCVAHVLLCSLVMA